MERVRVGLGGSDRGWDFASDAETKCRYNNIAHKVQSMADEKERNELERCCGESAVE